MHAIELVAPSMDAFRSTTLADPEPGPGEVVVRLRAATLNFVDIAVATGRFPAPKFPLVPVADGAGEVAAIGAGVKSVGVGDRVIPHFMPRWLGGSITPTNVAAMRGVSIPGSLAEYVVVSETSLVSLPGHLDFVNAAALPIAGTTAWKALRVAKIGPGSIIVLLGTGGVSILALQLAKAAGATVIVTSSSGEKLEKTRDLGADFTINYRSTPEWDDEVLRLTDGRGADLVVETVGEATIARSLRAAAYGGTVFTIGFLSGAAPTIDLFNIIPKALNVVGNNTGSVADLSEATRAIAAHKIIPIIGQTFRINEAADAYAALAAGSGHFGKIGIVD
jgi:NADPH:quinone reductase-like Zn-dependent oxidoreductase